MFAHERGGRRGGARARARQGALGRGCRDEDEGAKMRAEWVREWSVGESKMLTCKCKCKRIICVRICACTRAPAKERVGRGERALRRVVVVMGTVGTEGTAGMGTGLSRVTKS